MPISRPARPVRRGPLCQGRAVEVPRDFAHSFMPNRRDLTMLVPAAPPLASLRAPGGRHPRRGRRWLVWALSVWMAMPGCSGKKYRFELVGDLSHYRDVATNIELADVESLPGNSETSLGPKVLGNEMPRDFWDLSLGEAIQMALAQSQVMRDLRGRVVNNPTQNVSIYDPAITESDPRFGVQAALSQFDAIASSQIGWERNDRVLNNLFLSGGERLLQEDVGTFQAQLRKQLATGGQVSVRHNVDYDWNNRPTNLFPSVWNVNTEMEFRQPLLQGAGVEFNRIAGPNAQPGLFFQNGVVLARIDKDISLGEFERGVTKLVSDVESTYWQLYFAYRFLDNKLANRDAALARWRTAKALLEGGGPGGDAGTEARTAARYFSARAEVENALSGTPTSGLQSMDGNPLLSAGGLYATEAKLRLLLGLPENDGKVLRPADEPTAARLAFDWQEVMTEAMARRVELRQQKWRIKRRELEVVASKNFLKPRLDAMGQYRWRGFGDDLIGGGPEDLDTAYGEFYDGDFQEWALGLQWELKLGRRQAASGVRNAQLKLSKERALLEEQERHVVHSLAAAVRESARAHSVAQTYMNAMDRARDRVDAVSREYGAGVVTMDEVVEAEDELARVESNYFRSIIEYNLAVKDIHLEKGSLLEFNNIELSEGPWPDQAYQNARKQAHRRMLAHKLNYGITLPKVVSRGLYEQRATPTGAQPLVQAPASEEIQPGPAAGERTKRSQDRRETLPAPGPTGTPDGRSSPGKRGGQDRPSPGASPLEEMLRSPHDEDSEALPKVDELPDTETAEPPAGQIDRQPMAPPKADSSLPLDNMPPLPQREPLDLSDEPADLPADAPSEQDAPRAADDAPPLEDFPPLPQRDSAPFGADGPDAAPLPEQPLEESPPLPEADLPPMEFDEEPAPEPDQLPPAQSPPIGADAPLPDDDLPPLEFDEDRSTMPADDGPLVDENDPFAEPSDAAPAASEDDPLPALDESPLELDVPKLRPGKLPDRGSRLAPPTGPRLVSGTPETYGAPQPATAEGAVPRRLPATLDAKVRPMKRPANR